MLLNTYLLTYNLNLPLNNFFSRPLLSFSEVGDVEMFQTFRHQK